MLDASFWQTKTNPSKYSILKMHIQYEIWQNGSFADLENWIKVTKSLHKNSLTIIFYLLLSFVKLDKRGMPDF